MNARQPHALPLPERRGLNRDQAADYIGVSPSTFDAMVEDGRMPEPKTIGTRLTWDRLALDSAYEAIPNRNPGKVPSGEAGNEAGDDWDRRKIQ